MMTKIGLWTEYMSYQQMPSAPPPYQGGAYPPPAGYVPGYGGYPAGQAYMTPQPGYSQPVYYAPPAGQQTVVVVDERGRRDTDAEECCLLACCWAALCCCLASNMN